MPPIKRDAPNYSVPSYTSDEANARETFLALMWSLSYPGVAHALPARGEIDAIDQTASFTLIGVALLDIETTFYTPDPALASILRATGARSQTPEDAAYHFYPTLDADALDGVARASVGTMVYPDTAATLIVGAAHTGGARVTLTGPGIMASNVIAPGVPEAFWQIRARSVRYPLGWDVFFIDGSRVIGLPRSTHVSL
ncbi:MAG: phosphonate C-P lyase system protein PhnH [Chloroflexota bacterium]|nr:phosphonate C-P lyase system protein PhnH [Chloroflexota bacterium]